jgi:hypothetical protein
MKRILAFGLVVAGLLVAPMAALASGGFAAGPSVLSVPHRGPSVLAVPHHGEPSVLGIPPRPAVQPRHRHQGHWGPRQPVWVHPQWAWNGWQWVWVPGYWAR